VDFDRIEKIGGQQFEPAPRVEGVVEHHRPDLVAAPDERLDQVGSDEAFASGYGRDR
jgi:hypothetical protein